MAVAGALITSLIENLSSSDFTNFSRSAGLHSELQKLNNTLLKIQPLLLDAEKKQIQNTIIESWLQNLHHLAYDIDNLLDDLATEALRLQFSKGSHPSSSSSSSSNVNSVWKRFRFSGSGSGSSVNLNKESHPSSSVNSVSKIFRFSGSGSGSISGFGSGSSVNLNKGSHPSSSSSVNSVWKIIPTCCANLNSGNDMYGYEMRFKIDEITKNLSDLVDQKGILGLSDYVKRLIRKSRRVEQGSIVDEFEMVGREGDKEALMRLLKEPCDENVSVVAIVGTGGIGKTTLASVVYEELKGEFEVSAWARVSDEFDIRKVICDILKDVDGRDFVSGDVSYLYETLSKKRFLVVLDDVWNESYEKWEVLRRCFGVGAPGSKIVVTARNTMDASVMGYARPYHMKALSKEEALSLFALHAFGEPNFDTHPRLRVYGEGIVKKCDGLPLALMLLGRVLRRKTNVKEWKELLDSEVWSLQDKNNILPALRLCYYDLPLHLKRVFVYCSLFPKNYVFDKGELVLLWMAEGLLNQTNGGKSMESLGREYFEELKSRSFFQPSINGKSQHTMHDLIKDLATSVAGEFFSRANDRTGNEALEKSYHFSFISAEFRLFKKFKAFRTTNSLRTFLALPLCVEGFRTKSPTNVFVKLLPRLQFVRVLSMAGCSLKEVPQSIGNLKHLRYLNFSGTGIKSLPEQVGDLYNLQSLLVHNCFSLSSLPHSFEKLINLRHLDISGTALKKIPLGIGGLTRLQTLSEVIVEETDGFKISELKGLSDIQGRISIMGLHKVRNAMHARDAKLHEKKGLDDIHMEWRYRYDSFGYDDEITAYKVLEELKPHEKLKRLNISYYIGTRFPNWVGDPSFDQLTDLQFFNCSCTTLPTLGHLGSLRRLSVTLMNQITTIEPELLGSANSCHGVAYPSLEVLEFFNLPNWEKWSTDNGKNNGTVVSFPRLRKILITICPKLAQVSVGSIPSLQVLELVSCPESALRNMSGVSSSIHRLSLYGIEGLTHLHEEVIKHLGAVEYLQIQYCNELRYLWEESAAYKILVNLRELDVRVCQNLLSVGGKDVNLGTRLKSLREVSIRECNRLKSYHCRNGIEKLSMSYCSSLISLTFELPSTLKYLSIYLCDNLHDSCFRNNFLPSLESVFVNMWSNLRSFPAGCFTLIHITSLHITCCDNIELIPEKGFGFLPLLCLRDLHITCCENLNSFPYQHLERLTSLEEISIYGCPNLNYSFPCGSWPPNLSTLTIGNLKKPMSEWGSQNFPTSLVTLTLYGRNSGVVSFTREDVKNNNNTTSSCFQLPPSLTSLYMNSFSDLESLSTGLQHLTNLEELRIDHCPKLRDLPETLLLTLSSLLVYSCPELEKRCHDKTGDYWPIICEIPSCNL